VCIHASSEKGLPLQNLPTKQDLTGHAQSRLASRDEISTSLPRARFGLAIIAMLNLCLTRIWTSKRNI